MPTARSTSRSSIRLGACAACVASGYREITWHRGFIVELGYNGDMSLTFRRKIGWLVKLVVEHPEPFTFLRALCCR